MAKPQATPKSAVEQAPATINPNSGKVALKGTDSTGEYFIMLKKHDIKTLNGKAKRVTLNVFITSPDQWDEAIGSIFDHTGHKLKYKL